MNIKSILALLPVAVVVALSLGVPAANAENFNGRCENNEICFYKDKNFVAGIMDFSAGRNIGFLGNFNYQFCGSSCNGHDSASSLRVNGTRDVVLYKDINCAGNSKRLSQDGPGSRANLAIDAWDDGSGGVNDEIDSLCWR
ncbi:peptidase inhibitor family I36 protein [Streptosporangiaceae bacterium NEAU-GS5]|nr:peptidase inhibitor family I36 protein [Streptosporangiaceae bacterium NEAU-GS5]